MWSLTIAEVSIITNIEVVLYIHADQWFRDPDVLSMNRSPLFTTPLLSLLFDMSYVFRAGGGGFDTYVPSVLVYTHNIPPPLPTPHDCYTSSRLHSSESEITTGLIMRQARPTRRQQRTLQRNHGSDATHSRFA
jgi:hypothetical protein